jgi:hypothetical protein
VSDVADQSEQAVSVRRFSASKLSNAEACLKKFEFSFEKHPVVPSESRIVGWSYHAGQEAHYRARMGGVKLSPSDRNLAALARFEADSVAMIDMGVKWESSANDAFGKVIVMLNAYFDGGYEWPEDYRVIDVENKFVIDWIPGWEAVGVADIVLEDPCGWLIVDDHKTSGKKWAYNKHDPRKNGQGPWYAHWHEQLYQRPTLVTFSVMTYKGDFERRLATPRPDQVEAVMARAEGFARLLDAGVALPGNPSSTLCNAKWCDYWTICEWGAAIDS